MNTENQIIPFQEIELAGEKFRLVFDFNAQAAFEEVTGVTIGDLFDKRGRLVIASRFTRALLWAQLLHFDKQVQFDEFGRITVPPCFSMQQVGKMIVRGNFTEVTHKTREALLAFYANPKEKKGHGDVEGGAKNEPANPPGR